MSITYMFIVKLYVDLLPTANVNLFHEEKNKVKWLVRNENRFLGRSMTFLRRILENQEKAHDWPLKL